MKTSGELRLIILVDVLCNTRSCKSSLFIGIVRRWGLLGVCSNLRKMFFICRAIVGQLTHPFHSFFSNGIKEVKPKNRVCSGLHFDQEPFLEHSHIRLALW